MQFYAHFEARSFERAEAMPLSGAGNQKPEVGLLLRSDF
jgi:hypothetical protein